MVFGLSKCAKVVMRRGKLSRAESICLPSGEVIKTIQPQLSNKCLRLLEIDGIKTPQKGKYKSECLRQVRKDIDFKTE